MNPRSEFMIAITQEVESCVRSPRQRNAKEAGAGSEVEGKRMRDGASTRSVAAQLAQLSDNVDEFLP